MFRLALINPNTDPRHTEAMGQVARETLPDGCEVTAVSPERGPTSIESEADSVVAAAEVAALVRELPAHDAYLVACFGDPGVGAARELTEAPVVGIGEAAFQAAATIARRFAVITTLRRSIPELEDALERHGLRSRCVAVEPLGIPVADQGGHNPDTTAAIVEAGRRVVSEGGAEALVLACGGMADVAQTVRREVGRAGLRRRRVRRDDRVLALALRPLDQQGGRLRVARADRLFRHAGVRSADVMAATFREYGGPEVMRWEEVDDPVPGPDEVLIEVRACGLNHSDLDSRAGTSRWPFPMPWVLGAEFAGTVAARRGRRRGHRSRRPGDGLSAVRLRDVRRVRPLAPGPVRAVRRVRHRPLGRLRRACGGPGAGGHPARAGRTTSCRRRRRSASPRRRGRW